MFLIPNIILVGYGRTQFYQIKCLKCGEIFFPNPKAKELFCDQCLDLSEEELGKYIKSENESSEEYIGNIVGWVIKSGMSKGRSRYNYNKVYKRDEYTCQYCGYNPRTCEKFIPLSMDHFIPHIHGGSNKMSNLFVACMECNGIANDKLFNTFEDKKKYILQQRKYKGLYVNKTLADMYELKEKEPKKPLRRIIEGKKRTNYDLMQTLYDQGLDDKEIARTLRCGHTTVNEWRRGKNLPSNYVPKYKQIEIGGQQ